MDQNDRQAIEGLFGKLSQVEQQSGPRDGDAETFIKDRIARQPAAPYFMAQTIVVQEQALNSAQQRIEELEYQLSQRSSGGGLLAGLFGSSAPRPAPRRPAPAPQSAGPGGNAASGPWGNQGQVGQQRGGGFLAGAAQTAMGVAGGVLLGSAIGSMFAGDAQAAEPDAPVDDAADAGGDDSMGDMDF